MSAARAFLRAFPAAWNGLVECVAGQRNMRVHVVIAVLACTACASAALPGGSRAAVLACVGLVLAAEALNTGVEALVDLLSPAHHERARAAKDAAAGAVLAAAAAAVLVAGAVALGAWPSIREARAVPAASGAAIAAVDAIALASRWPRALPGVALVAGAAAGVPLVLGALDAASVVAVAALHVLACAGARRRSLAPPA
jgi:diacylglycerol kinase